MILGHRARNPRIHRAGAHGAWRGHGGVVCDEGGWKFIMVVQATPTDETGSGVKNYKKIFP